MDYPGDPQGPLIALQQAVSSGGTTVEVRASAGAMISHCVAECELAQGLERGEMELHYQPQIDMSGNLAGLEALIRWNHPTYGLLLPGKFMPFAEASGLVLPLGTWVLREACRQMAAWRDTEWPAVRVAVNISAHQLAATDFVHIVCTAMQDAQLAPEYLRLELTETAAVESMEDCGRVLGQLRSQGISIAIDDFGTGYSSLSRLQALPVDTLKIDQSFFRTPSCERTMPILRGTTAMAHDLGMVVIAEGIERPTQMELARQSGVDQVQGFLFDRPLPASAVRRDNYWSHEVFRMPAEAPMGRAHKLRKVGRSMTA